MKGKMTKFIYKYSHLIILSIYIILFFLIKHPYQQHDRIIISDGKAYYAYLPAVLIYHDMEFNFIEYYEEKYYPDDESVFKEFRFKFGGETVNKAFPGLALLMLPFFLIAHFLSLITGFNPDGYSIIYQYAIGFSAFFYFWLGLYFLKKLLAATGARQNVAAVIIFLIAFGTNIIYYTICEGSMNHVYSFSIITIFLYSVKKHLEDFKICRLIFASFLYGLIIAIRPVNALIIIAIPLIAGNMSSVRNLISTIFRDKNKLLYMIFAFSVMPLLTMLLWYVQTGRLLVYSYGDEGFNFSGPHFFQILFSFNKGWFVYTPLALISMAGFFYLFKRNKFGFWWILAFYLIFIYITSSWWCWHYTSNFSQRVFIDIYAIVALMLFYFYLMIKKNRLLKKAMVVIVLLFVGLNCLQFYQHYKYIFPPGTIDFEKYKNSFTRLVPAARADFPDSLILKNEILFNDFEKDYEWLNYKSVTDSLAFNGKYSSQAGLVNEYSIGLYKQLSPLLHSENVWVKVSCWIFSDVRNSTVRMVVDFESDGKSYFYKPFYMKDFNIKNKWVYIEFALEAPELLTENDKLRVYFINTSEGEKFFIDDLKIEILSLNEKFEFY